MPDIQELIESNIATVDGAAGWLWNSLGRPAGLLEEMQAEARLALVIHARTWKADRGAKFSTYIRSMAVWHLQDWNRVRTGMRTNRGKLTRIRPEYAPMSSHVVRCTPDTHTQAPDDICLDHEREQLVGSLMAELSQVKQRIMQRTVFDGVEAKEIAPELGLSANTVRKHAYDARLAMRKKLCSLNITHSC